MTQEQLKELKAELSKLSGVNMFNPKFRAVFKRYVVDETKEAIVENVAEEVDAGEATPKEAAAEVKAEIAEVKDEAADEAVQEKAAEVIEDIDADQEAGEPSEVTTDDSEELVEDIEKNKEADEEVKEAEETQQKTELTAEEKRLKEVLGETDESSDSATGDTSEAPNQPETIGEAATYNDELLVTKLELALIRAGIREDRLDVAKELFLPKVRANGNVDMVKKLITQYPEWLATAKGTAQGFGMPLGEKTDPLTAEERALKKMGINPRD